MGRPVESCRAVFFRTAGIIAWVILLCTTVAFAQTVSDPTLQITEVVSGLASPTAMAFIGPGDILVLQKADGRVRRVVNGALQPGQVLDVAVHSSSERGLLGIAVHPNFPTAPFVYLYYTESGTGSDTSGASTPLGNRDRKSTRLNSSHIQKSRMPSSA